MKNESYFSALFDLGFTKYASKSFIRVLYIIAIVIVVLQMVLSLLTTWTDAVHFTFAGQELNFGDTGTNGDTDSEDSGGLLVVQNLVRTAIIFVQALINLAVIRMTLEIVVALVNTAAAWGRIKQRGLPA